MDGTLGVYMSDYGVIANGQDQSANIEAALASGNTKFIFPKGKIRVNRKIQINKRAVEFIGHGYGRTEENATILEFYGDGEFISLGNVTTASFSGPQGFTMRQMSLIYMGANRGTLNNPFSVNASTAWYGTGTYAIRDWRGGGVKLIDTLIEHFQYGFWGTQSDINRFINVKLFYNKTALYLENRSDQFLADGLYTFGNDNTLTMADCMGGRLLNCQFVKEGSKETYPIELNSCSSMLFDGNWYESPGDHKVTVPAYIRIGAAGECRNIIFRSSSLAIGAKMNGTDSQVNYFIQVVRGKFITVDEVGGYVGNLKKLVSFTGDSLAQDVNIKLSNTVPFADGTYFDQNGTGRASIVVEQFNEHGKTVMGLTRIKAHVGAAQTIPGGVWTRVKLDSTTFDELGEFNKTTNQWTAKQSGYYRITSLQMIGIQAAGNRLQLAVFLNTDAASGGTPWGFIDDRIAPAAGGGSVAGSMEVKVNAGHKLDLRLLSAKDITLVGGGGKNYFFITRI